jgi:polar amino acid transport system substrate-binding protein
MCVLLLAQKVYAEPIPNPHVLRIGVESANPPFNSLDRKGGIKGFEPDFALELCRRLTITCVFERLTWDRLIPALEMRRVDMLINALPIPDELPEGIAYSTPYYRTPAAFMIEKKGLPFDPVHEMFKNKTIGTLEKETFQEYLKATFPQAQVQIYATIEEAYLDALSERIDIIFADRLSLQAFVRTTLGACCQVIGKDHADPAFFGKGFGIALRSSDNTLKQRVDDAIMAMKRDGTLERLAKPYFTYAVHE